MIEIWNSPNSVYLKEAIKEFWIYIITVANNTNKLFASYINPTTIYHGFVNTFGQHHCKYILLILNLYSDSNHSKAVE